MGTDIVFGPTEAARKMMEGCLTKAKTNLKAKKGGQ